MKYKVGDKIVLTVSDVSEKAYYSYYVFNNNDLILWEPSTDNYAETLSTYTEPLEAKIRRQAAEITRLLRENKELKNEKQELTRERNQLMGRCGGLSAAKIKAFNNGRLAGQNEAWELARKLALLDADSGYSNNELKEIFGSICLDDIFNLTYTSAAAKVEAWEKAREEIKVGDVVESNTGNGKRIVVTDVWLSFDGLHFEGISPNRTLTIDASAKYYTKTGRHIDIDGFLKQIGEE